MKKTSKRILSVLLSAIMVLSVVPVTALTAFAATEIEYLERSWDGEKVVTETKICENPTPIQNIGDSYGCGMSHTSTLGPWYYVTGTVRFNNRINVYADEVHLILCDGARLEAKLGIHVGPGKTLVIHGQANETGHLSIDDCDKYEAGIGSNDYDDDGESSAGTMIFQGGSVYARGNSDGAGIGGGNESDGGTLALTGGAGLAIGALTTAFAMKPKKKKAETEA